MLLEYIRSAQEGMLDERAIAFLIDRLEEIQGYYEAGKMIVPGEEELKVIRKSITEFTAALMEDEAVRQTEMTGTDDFCIMKGQLKKQLEMIERIEKEQI